jgi:hypothetical protein
MATTAIRTFNVEAAGSEAAPLIDVMLNLLPVAVTANAVTAKSAHVVGFFTASNAEGAGGLQALNAKAAMPAQINGRTER